jgi:hypothetical protein
LLNSLIGYIVMGNDSDPTIIGRIYAQALTEKLRHQPLFPVPITGAPVAQKEHIDLHRLRLDLEDPEIVEYSSDLLRLDPVFRHSLAHLSEGYQPGGSNHSGLPHSAAHDFSFLAG